VLYLFVEGRVTETSYAEQIDGRFGKEYRFHLEVRGRGTGGKPRDLVKAAIQVRAEWLPGMRQRRDPEREPEVWCLFDRDEHPEVDAVIAVALRNGVRVAFSHPCFELWLLLHFQMYEAQLSGQCAAITGRLRQHPGFEDYQKQIGTAEWKALCGHFDEARARALQLVERCPTDSCGLEENAPHCVPTSRDPSSDVWRLLDSLHLSY